MITSSGSSTPHLPARTRPTAWPASAIESCGAGIAIVGETDQLIHGHVRAVDLPKRGGQRRSARDGGQAAPVTATAYLTLGVHRRCARARRPRPRGRDRSGRRRSPRRRSPRTASRRTGSACRARRRTSPRGAQGWRRYQVDGHPSVPEQLGNVDFGPTREVTPDADPRGVQSDRADPRPRRRTPARGPLGLPSDADTIAPRSPGPVASLATSSGRCARPELANR